jgi:hypothetical protein
LASPSSRPTDPDFDPPMIAWPPEKELAAFRKVVVNPFLAVFGLLAWFAAMRALILGRMPHFAAFLTATFAGIPFLLHYHCLDCGRTGVLPFCGRHACSGVVARWRTGKRARSAWPRPDTQMAVWLWIIVSVSLLVAVIWR